MEQSQLCGISDFLPAQHTVVAQKEPFHQSGEFPFPHFGNRQDHIISINFCHSHMVFRKSSCLIRAHHSYGAQGFHCRQLPYNSIYLYHPSYSQGKDNGHYCRKALRNSSYCQ